MIDLSPYRNVAVRAWTEPTKKKPVRPSRKPKTRPPIRHALVFDTETTTDTAQGLLFGAFRYAKVDGATVTTVAEGLIYADDLPQTAPAGFALLRAYADSRKADVDMTYLGAEPSWELQLLSRAEFCKQWVWHVGYPHNNRLDPATIVAFNAPFDLSRIATDVAEARRDMRGGFSFTLWTDENSDPAPFRPRLAIKALDSKRALKKFRKVEPGRHDHAGHILDLRTLVFALTGQSHSLDSACDRFNVPGKATPPEFGTISTDAVDYCRQDVAATTALLEAVLAEYDRHPIDLQPTQAYSPASIAKAYLSAMGIKPRLSTQPDFPPQILGQAMSAFYGGRAEVHVRHVPVPVQVLDFTSMYPTVDTLMGIWELVTAQRIDPVDATSDVQDLLDTITSEDCFDQARWKDFIVIAELIPNGDVLPVRADYRPEQWSIGVNHLHSEQPLWYTLPDLIASKLLSGRTPQIRRAIRFTPNGQQEGMRTVALRGGISVDPNSEDFFQRVVELRQEIRDNVPTHDHTTCACEECGLDRFLKVLANSGSYGIYAEMIRQEQPDTVIVYNGSTTPFASKANAPERPGTYCFPPIAACITGAARLMLALLEQAITERGGTWVFCDTDSMAIASTQQGDELIACPGGPTLLPDGTPAIRTLSHDTVRAITLHFDCLNPYDTTLVPKVLKLEEVGTCYAISAKRYAIYDAHRPGHISAVNIIKRSEHGLGRYLSPGSDGSLDWAGHRDWVDEAWNWIIMAHVDSDAEQPRWSSQPAVSRVTVSTPILLRPFSHRNRGKVWSQRVKPFNFLLVADLDPFGIPPSASQGRFRLITPYATQVDGRQLDWYNLYDPGHQPYSVTTTRDTPPSSDVAIMRSYGQVLREYRSHPEYKFFGPNGEPCLRATQGTLRRRSIHPIQVVLIGKEANHLEEVQAGLVGKASDVVVQYGSSEVPGFGHRILPILARYSGRELARVTGVDRRTIDRVRAGQVPRSGLRQSLEALATTLAARDLNTPWRERGHDQFGRLDGAQIVLAWHLRQRPACESSSTEAPPTMEPAST